MQSRVCQWDVLSWGWSVERRRTGPLQCGCWLRHILIKWEHFQWPGQLVWEPDLTLWSSRDSQSGFPAASSVEGRAAAGEVGGLSVAPVFSSCLPSYNFVTIYFPLLNPVLLEIPRVVSIAYTRCLLYAVLLYTLSLSDLHRRQPVPSHPLTHRWSQSIFQDPCSSHYSMPPSPWLFIFQIKFPSIHCVPDSRIPSRCPFHTSSCWLMLSNIDIYISPLILSPQEERKEVSFYGQEKCFLYFCNHCSCVFLIFVGGGTVLTYRV